MEKYKYMFLITICLLVLTGCGNQNKDLICAKIEGKEKTILKYSFDKGKVCILDYLIETEYVAVENEESNKNFTNTINDIPGCSVTWKKDGVIIIHQICDLRKMSDEDIEKVYMQKRVDLQQTRKEIINNYKIDKDMVCK